MKTKIADWYTGQWPSDSDGFDDNPLRVTIKEWCTEQFGPPSMSDFTETDKRRWSPRIGFVKFRDEKDYMFYVLRWS